MGILADIRLILTLSCRESSRLLSQRMDARLTLAQRVALRGHLLGCRACRRFNRQLLAIRQLFSSLPEASDVVDRTVLSEAARQRIRTALQQARDELS